MHKKAIIHVMSKARLKSEAFTSELNAIEELSEKYWIKNVIFYKWETIEYKNLLEILKKYWILIYNYSNKDDLKKQVLKFALEYEIIFVATSLELLVNTVNEVKAVLWRPMSDNPNIFRNKSLQRELIQAHNPELWIKFIKGIPEKLDIKKIEEKVWYPFIIKPVDWVQSSWVAKITNSKDFHRYIEEYNDFHDRLKSRWVDNKELIVEEFINWKMYSIDYFITSEWEVRLTKPVKVRLWTDVKVDDYCNIARISTEKTENEFLDKNLNEFVSSTVKATWIRNTFVHHEFKINSKWELKTIELNGRIWGWRMELMKRAYDFNMFELIVNPDAKPWELKENNIAVNIYATKRWMLRWFNKKLFERIKARESVFEVMFEDWVIWKEIWLTKDWFIKVWVIKLRNNDYSILSKDFIYIKSKYKELLNIDEFINQNTDDISEVPKEKVKTVFSRFTDMFKTKK